MQSDAPDVDTYLGSVPEARKAVLTELRDHCRRLLPSFDEQMGYGMPGYVRDGVGEVGFASQKQYISLYIVRTDVLDAHRDQLTGLDVGKGCIRYRRPEQVDFEVVDAMLRAIEATTGPVC